MGEALEMGDAMGERYYDPAVWHRDTWKFRRAEREFQIEIAQRALSDILEDEARYRQQSRMVALAQTSDRVEGLGHRQSEVRSAALAHLRETKLFLQ
eukprot:3764151-Pyramimonas_sp.AAC.1